MHAHKQRSTSRAAHTRVRIRDTGKVLLLCARRGAQLDICLLALRPQKPTNARIDLCIEAHTPAAHDTNTRTRAQTGHVPRRIARGACISLAGARPGCARQLRSPTRQGTLSSRSSNLYLQCEREEESESRLWPLHTKLRNALKHE